MNIGHDFKGLFKRWQAKELTPEEVTVLMKMIDSGKYARELNELSEEFKDSEKDNAEISLDYLQENYKAAMEKRDAFEAAFIQRQMSKKSGWSGSFIKPAAIAATIVFLLASGILVFNSFDRSNKSETAANELIKVSDRHYFRLPDGTSVMLNEGSTLTYKMGFEEKVREVTLTGEAFFDVTHEPNRPFIVRTRDVNTTVLGTAFNVNSFDSKVTVTVVRGKVKVGSKDEVFGLLTPDEEIVVDDKTMQFSKTEVRSDEAVTWNKSFIIMDDVTMREAALIISERFNVKVTVASDELAKCKIKTSFVNDETLEEILELISFSMNGSFSQRGKTYVITGKC